MPPRIPVESVIPAVDHGSSEKVRAGTRVFSVLPRLCDSSKGGAEARSGRLPGRPGASGGPADERGDSERERDEQHDARRSRPPGAGRSGSRGSSWRGPRGRRRGGVVGGPELVGHGRGPHRRVHDRDRVDAVDEPAALRLDHLYREDPGADLLRVLGVDEDVEHDRASSRRRSRASGGSSSRSPDRTGRARSPFRSRGGLTRSAARGRRAPKPCRVAALHRGRDEAVEQACRSGAGRPARASGGC